MNRRRFLENIGLAAVASGATYWFARRSRFSGGSYVQMGTSVTSGGPFAKHSGSTPAIVGGKLDMLAINAAFPGSCAGLHKFKSLDPVSLCSLADAIVSNDWSLQSGRTGDTVRDAAMSKLMTAGFGSVTHLGLEYGTNDFRYDRPIGLDTDSRKETFKGALNYSLQKLFASYPGMRVFLITPAWMPTIDGLDSDEHPNGIGSFLKEYVDAMTRIAELNHIPCLDLWRNLEVNKTNYKTFTVDGTHPNDLGAMRRGEMIASFMNATF
jgi:lysophospholipase L1-like esterase